jgi:DNA replication protein DnaC
VFLIPPPSLGNRFLTDEESEELYAQYPDLVGDPERYCPTCLKKNGCTYIWKGQTYDCDCYIQLQLHKHYLKSGIGVLYQRYSWDDFVGSPSLRQICDSYIEAHEQLVNRGIGIILSGSFGTGKTMAMNLLLKDLVHAGYSCFGTTFTGMVEMFTSGWRSASDQRRFEQKIVNSKILLLDDLGKEFRTKTNLAESTFDSVLRRRVQDGKPTLLTTNMLLAEMETGYGAAIFSLLREVSITEEVTGEDFRPRAAQRTLSEITSGETRPIV